MTDRERWMVISAYLFFGFVLALVALLSCQSCKPTPTPEPVPPGPPAPLPEGVCNAFCYQLERFGCPGAQGSPGHDEVMGTSDDGACVDVCTNYVKTTFSTSDESCLEHATNCGQVETCLMGE
jgi:hypothetical protein